MDSRQRSRVAGLNQSRIRERQTPDRRAHFEPRPRRNTIADIPPITPMFLFRHTDIPEGE
jgi:hypothetical protein